MSSSTIKSELEILFPRPPVEENPAKEIDGNAPLVRQSAAVLPGNDSLLNSMRLLWERRRLLRRAAVCGLFVATLAAFLIPKKYESTTRLMPPDEQSGAGMALMGSLGAKMGGGLGALAGDVLSVKTSGALFIGILGSRSVQDKVIAKFNLRNVYGKKSLEAARMKLASNTTVAEDRKSGLIVISVSDRDPQRAAGLAAEYVTELNFVTRDLSTSSARRERDFLEGRLIEVEKDLETAEKNLSEFASRNSAIDIKEQGKALVDAAAALQGQLIAGESDLQGLKQVYADGNFRVRTLAARVAELRAQLAKLGGEEQTGSDWNRSQDEALYPSIRKLPLLGVSYADLYRRTKVQEAVFETLTQEYELAKVAEAKQTPSVKVLDPANLPETRLLPLHFFASMFLGACLAVAATAAFLFGLGRWRGTAADDPHKLLALEVFASVQGWTPWTDAGAGGLSPSASGAEGAEPSRWRRVSYRVWSRLRHSNRHEIMSEDWKSRA
jgi:uncharacterized protein involved in exopolysaccharide biosynthesis